MDSNTGAVIIWDFSPKRWSETIRLVTYTVGRAEAERRMTPLPPAFRKVMLAYLQGEDISDRTY